MRLLFTRSALAAALLVAGSSMAQAFPQRAVTIIVPFAAGGGTDITTRLMQGPMAATLGTDVVVKNIDGAGGTIGAAETASATADGHTVGMLPVGPLTTQPHLRKLPYGADSFEYVCLAYSAPTAFAVRKDSPFNSLKELVAYAKKNPRKMTFAVQAIGSVPHIAGLALADLAGIEMEYLPVNGDGPALKALLDGTADLFVPHISFFTTNAEQLKSLAILQSKRLEAYPKLPTAKEQGYDIDVSIWGGLAVAKGTPKEAVAKLDTACKAAVESKGFQAQMAKLKQPTAYLPAVEFAAFVKAEFERNRRLLQKAGLNPK